MTKLAFVINGSGGAGKDTLCELAAKHFKTVNVSSIDPIKKIARENGWNGEKDLKSRKFLADLKQVFS
jgi:adenylate kinase family enzyme